MIITSLDQLSCLKQFNNIGFDLETYDPNLKTLGPGAHRRKEENGCIVGLSFAVISDFEEYTFYLPVNHATGNLDIDEVMEWIKENLCGEHVTLYGANISYDLMWMASYGVEFKGRAICVQLVESLIDEEREFFKLEVLSQEYLEEDKDKTQFESIAKRLGIKEKEVFSRIRDTLPEELASYAEKDALLCLQIFEKQKEELDNQELWDVLELEIKLMPIIVKMTMTGVKCDVDSAKKYNKELLLEELDLEDNVYEIAGEKFNINSTDQVATILDKFGIVYPLNELTKKVIQWNKYLVENDREDEVVKEGSPSIRSPWLSKQDHEICKAIVEFKETQKNRRDFIESTILEGNVDGRIHSQFHQNKKDSDGTRSGRLSSSNPNLQQQPSRNEKWKKIIRGLYLPEPGEMWARFDYKAQEPLLIIHFGCLREMGGAREMAERINSGEKVDPHQITADILGIPRKAAKEIKLGRAYGLGVANMGKKLGTSFVETKELIAKLDCVFPYATTLHKEAKSLVEKRGYIKTVLGRRKHFTLWTAVKNDYEWKNNIWPEPYPTIEEARAAYPYRKLERYKAYKAVNSMIQGSGADMVKKAMIDIYTELGLVPLVQVHDELDYSVDSIETALKIKHIMETTLNLVVKIQVDTEIGTSWSDLKEIENL